MAADRKHPRILTAGWVTILALAITAIPSAAGAHNQWIDSYRRWPWYAGESRTLTTLPGECPHCPAVQSSSAWQAIDAAMHYETVYSIGPGRVDRWEASGGGAGKYLRIRDDDGTYITYEHLSKALVTSGPVFAGQPIAVSGCTGNCSGPHLHFQRHDGPSFNSKALTLAWISGHGGKRDPFVRQAYTGDNAGIGLNATGGASAEMLDAFERHGGYAGMGVTANLGDGWSPCRTDTIHGTWFRYWCAPRSGWGGGVQTFLGPGERQRALMQKSGSPDVFLLHRGILGAYTQMYGGQDWIYWLGYPTNDRWWTGDGYVQNFEHGYIRYYSDCREIVVSDLGPRAQYAYCD